MSARSGPVPVVLGVQHGGFAALPPQQSHHAANPAPQPRVIGEVLLRDLSAPAPRRGPRVEEAADAATLQAYRDLRHREFVLAQGLFAGSDLDDVDDDPRTVVLVARDADGAVARAACAWPPATTPTTSGGGGVAGSSSPRGGAAAPGPALVRAACARAEAAGVLRFDATVQQRYAGLFAPARLGRRRGPWRCTGTETPARPHAVARSAGSPRWWTRRSATSAPCSHLSHGQPGRSGLRRRRRRARPRQRPDRRLRRDPAVDGRARPGVGRVVRGAGQRQRPGRDGRRPRRPARRPRRPRRAPSPPACSRGLRRRRRRLRRAGARRAHPARRPGVAVGHRPRPRGRAPCPAAGAGRARRCGSPRTSRAAGARATRAASGTPRRGAARPSCGR